LTNPVEFEKIRADRKLAAIASPDNSYSRLKVREVVQEKNLKRLRRSYHVTDRV